MKKFSAEVQVDKEHYELKHEVSFLNAFNQLKDILFLVNEKKLSNPKILIIGVGDNILATLLRHKFGFYVRTMDIDKDLDPDAVGSVDNLKDAVQEEFDIIVCAHVLEHLPSDRFEASLRQIHKASKYSLIYLPIAKFGLLFEFGLHPIFKKRISLLSTWFFKSHRFDGQHYWEIGTRGFSLKKTRKYLRKYFVIVNEYNAENWLYSYNFILESK